MVRLFRHFTVNAVIATAGMFGIGLPVAEAVPTPIAISTGAVNFGAVSVGTSRVIAVTVTNTHAVSAFGPINIFGGSPPAAQFNASQTCQGVTLAPGGTCRISYTFTPSAGGRFNDSSSFTISETSRQSDGEDFVVSLTGAGAIPITAAPLSHDFGNVNVGSTAVATTLITNTGTQPFGPINIFGGSPPTAEFNASQSCQGTTLAPGGTCTISYTFTPSPRGTFNDSSSFTISATSSQSDGVNFVVSLTGTGAFPITVAPLSHDFGNVNVGSTATATTAVTNTGAQPFGPINIFGGAPPTAEFNASQSCQGTTLAPGGTCTISYTFTPSAGGPFNDSSSFTISATASQAAGADFSVHLTGCGFQSAQSCVAEAGTQTAVEYSHSEWGYYFVTSFASEISALDGGAFGGVWQRTGQTFLVWEGQEAGTSPVCRFFSTSFAPRSSHFYTPFADECDTVKRNPDWQYEAASFYVKIPSGTGSCPAGSVPLYRLFNDGMGGAPNHRYTTSSSIANEMRALGWVPEGLGSAGVLACVPSS